MKRLPKESIFNKHFIKLLLVFLVIIILTITFRSFLEDALKSDKNLGTPQENLNSFNR